jgi:hypothetical protein
VQKGRVSAKRQKAGSLQKGKRQGHCKKAKGRMDAKRQKAGSLQKGKRQDGCKKAKGRISSVSRSGCATGKKTRTGPDCNWLQLDQWSGFFIFLIKQPQATGLFHRLLTGCNRFITANRFSIKIPTKLAQSLENWMKIE